MQQLIAKTIGVFINLVSYVSPKTAGHLAIQLFSRPRRLKFKETEKDFLDTAFTEDIKYQNINIQTYRWLGKKDTILLAHGWESNTYRWRTLIEQLTALDYNVIALDAPAHGYSGGKLFNAILYSECIHLVAKKFKANVVIGHSVGGMASAFFHSKYQLPSIDKLVLLGAPSNFVGVFGRYVTMMGYNNRLAKAMDHIILERFNQKPEYFNAARFLEGTNIKGLIIHDVNDKIIPYTDAEDYNRHYEKSKLITTKGFGHGLRSEEVNHHILDFISA